MISKLKSFICAIVTINLVCAPTVAGTARTSKKQFARAPQGQAAPLKSAATPAAKSTFVPDYSVALRIALALHVKKLNSARSNWYLLSSVFPGLTKADMRYFFPRVMGLKTIPVAILTGPYSVRYYHEGQAFDAVWDPKNPFHMKMGNVSFVFDPKQPWHEQAELLERKLNGKNNALLEFWRFLRPANAHAVIGQALKLADHTFESIVKRINNNDAIPEQQKTDLLNGLKQAHSDFKKSLDEDKITNNPLDHPQVGDDVAEALWLKQLETTESALDFFRNERTKQLGELKDKVAALSKEANEAAELRGSVETLTQQLDEATNPASIEAKAKREAFANHLRNREEQRLNVWTNLKYGSLVGGGAGTLIGVSLGTGVGQMVSTFIEWIKSVYKSIGQDERTKICIEKSAKGESILDQNCPDELKDAQKQGILVPGSDYTKLIVESGMIVSDYSDCHGSPGPGKALESYSYNVQLRVVENRMQVPTIDNMVYASVIVKDGVVAAVKIRLDPSLRQVAAVVPADENSKFTNVYYANGAIDDPNSRAYREASADGRAIIDATRSAPNPHSDPFPWLPEFNKAGTTTPVRNTDLASTDYTSFAPGSTDARYSFYRNATVMAAAMHQVCMVPKESSEMESPDETNPNLGIIGGAAPSTTAQ